MNRSHSFQNLLDTVLAPEVEAGPLSTQHAAPSTRPPPERLGWAWKASWWTVMLLAAAVIAANSKMPGEPVMASGTPAEPLRQVQHLDHHEQCLVIRYLDDKGRERHKHTHCPGLEANGLMAWPLEAKR